MLLSLVHNPDILAVDAPSLANLALRIGLSGVTLVSGIGKIVDPASGRQAMVDFGVPPRLVSAAAAALPVVEVILGLAVLNDGTATLASITLAMLFCLFSLGVGNLLRQDKAPPCNCFGAVHSEPVSAWTLIRVLALSILAATCALLPVFPLVTTWWKFGLLTGVYLAAAAGLKRWAKSKRQVSNRLQVGQRIPAIKTRDGRWLKSVLPAQKRALILLSSSSCGACLGIKANLVRWSPALSADLSVIELVAVDEAQSFEPTEGLPSFALDRKSFSLFRAPTPTALLTDHTGTLLEPPVSGGQAIEALIRASLRRS